MWSIVLDIMFDFAFLAYKSAVMSQLLTKLPADNPALVLFLGEEQAGEDSAVFVQVQLMHTRCKSPIPMFGLDPETDYMWRFKQINQHVTLKKQEDNSKWVLLWKKMQHLEATSLRIIFRTGKDRESAWMYRNRGKYIVWEIQQGLEKWSSQQETDGQEAKNSYEEHCLGGRAGEQPSPQLLNMAL